MESDDLTNDGLARLLVDTQAHARLVNGRRVVTIEADVLTNLVQELLELRQKGASHAD